MLPRAHRLRRSAEIRHVRRKGLRRSHPLLHLFAVENNLATARFAVSVSKRVGNAVVRNRLRRRIREVIRRQLANIQPGWDFLIIVRAGAPAATFSELEQAVKHLLTSIEVLNGRTA